MANLIIKSSADNLVLQGSDASPAITVGATGTTTFAENATLSGTANAIGTVATGNISNTAIVYPAGHILQTVTAFEAGEMSTSSTTTPGATLGLSVPITPTAATNKILISCTLGLVSIDGSGASIVFNIHSSLASGVIKVGTASSARVGGLFRAGARINNDGNHNWGITFNVVDTPTTWSSGSITYTLYAWGESTTVYVGRSDTNSNVSDAYGAMCSSTMLAQEIKV